MSKKLDHDEIRLLIEEGKTADEIAYAVSGRPETIRILARKWGLRISKRNLSNEGRYASDTINYLKSIQHPKPKDVRQGEGLSQAPSN